MKFAGRFVVVFMALMFFGLLNVAALVLAHDYHATYTVDQKQSICSSTEAWLADTYDLNLPSDVMVITAKWWNGQFTSYTENPGQPGQTSGSGWMIEDVPAGIGYPYTFTEYLAYYSPSEAMQPAIFWFNLTCDNGVVTDVNMQQP